MKLYLASFLEQENFGSGKVIGIVNGEKPSHIKCDSKYPHLTPNGKLIDNYNQMALSDPLNAGKVFVEGFNKQLSEFTEQVLSSAEETGKTCQEFLPFEEGDTLASWERHAFTNYRDIVAKYLEKLGYEVNLK